MICLVCRQAEIVEAFTSVHFERDEMHLVITRVPARVCQSCGEAYVDQATASQLLRMAKELSEAGMLDEEREYGDFV